MLQLINNMHKYGAGLQAIHNKGVVICKKGLLLKSSNCVRRCREEGLRSTLFNSVRVLD